MGSVKCEECDYWRCLDGQYNPQKACHYLLIEGHMKQKDAEGNCLCFKPKEG